MPSDVALTVNGRIFGGWKTVEIARGIEDLSGAFALTVSDRWRGQDRPWQIVEGDECSVAIDGVTLITGYVDKRSVSYSARDHALSVSGRDKAADLIDCSARLDVWEFAQQRIDKIVAAVAAPFGISVRMAQGLAAPATRERFAINHGETAFDVIERACQLAGVLAVSDGAGGIVLTRTPSGRAATPLIEGGNILEASGEYDVTDRFARYVVSTQSAGSDEIHGEAAAHVEAESTDRNVRPGRILIIPGEGNMTLAQARERANWEATVRAAQAGTATVTVQDWKQGNGALWPINALVPLRSPWLGIDGDMLIKAVTFRLDRQGTRTELALTRPDAFLPAPFIPENTDPYGVGTEE